MMNVNAKWIRVPEDIGDISPRFCKAIYVKNSVKKATLYVSAMGVYNAYLNGNKIGNALLAPGFTSYSHRALYQEYDVTGQLTEGENRLEIICGKGWALGCFGNSGAKPKNFADNISVIAYVKIKNCFTLWSFNYLLYGKSLLLGYHTVCLLLKSRLGSSVLLRLPQISYIRRHIYRFAVI